jgi:hypothetical protein
MAMAVTALRNAGVINQDAIMRDAADDAGSTFQGELSHVLAASSY